MRYATAFHRPLLATLVAAMWLPMALLAAPHEARRLRRDVTLGFAPSVRGRPGALALANPAALALAQGVGLGLVGSAGGDRFDGERGVGWALAADASFGDFALGFAFARTTDPAPPGTAGQSAAGLSSVVVGLGSRIGRLLRVGAALRPLLDVDDGVLSLDIGLVADITPWFALGATMQDALAATRYLRAPTLPIVSGPQLVFGAALGEIGGEWQIGLDATWPDGAAMRRVSANLEIWARADVVLGVELRRALDAAAGVGAKVAAADVRASATTRIAGQVRWIDGNLELAPSVWLDDDQVGGRSYGLGLLVAWQLAPAPWLRGRGQSPPSARGRRAMGQRRSKGGRVALYGSRELAPKALSEIARSVLALHASLAAERGDHVCGWIAQDGARLDVESVEPPLSSHLDLSRDAICAQLRTRQGPWASYMRELGPAMVHAQMARFLPLLFRLHGAVIGALPADRAQALASLLQRDAADLRCRSYSARAFEGLGGIELVEVKLGCPAEAEVKTVWIAEGQGYRLTRLAVDHRPGQVAAPAEPPASPQSPQFVPGLNQNETP